MKSLCKDCFHSMQTFSRVFQWPKDSHNVQPLLQCYLVLICLYVIEQQIRYFIDPETEYRELINFIPIGVLLLLLISLFCLKEKSLSIHYEKDEYEKYVIYFDIPKFIAYLIFSVTLIESKVFEVKYRSSETFESGYWVSLEFILISIPSFIFLQNSFFKFGVVFFQLYTLF